MPIWTESQSEVINHRGCNLLVSAAAGSGKTAVMIEHIFSLISGGDTSVDKLLVVTFTNAAAASMKEKLVKKLDEAYSKTPDDENLLRQKQLVDRSDISTIHAFCIKTLRRYYFHTPLSPDFRILDTTQEELLAEAAINEVLEISAKRYNDGLFPEYNDALLQFASPKSDIALGKAIRAFDRFTKYMPHQKEFKELILKDYQDPSIYEETVLKYYKSILVSVKERIDNLVEEFGNSDIAATCMNFADPLYLYVEKALDSQSAAQLKQAIDEPFPKLDTSAVTPLKELFKTKVAFIKKTCQGISKAMTVTNGEDLKDLIPALKGLFAMHEAYIAVFEELCLNEGGTTFTGVLRYTASLLENNAEVLNDIRKDIDYIYVDEYQDVNSLQNYIIEMLSKGNNMFFVGDIKQSIYGFQLARPELFKEKMFSYQSGVLGRRINLRNNFRSYPQILEAVNFIFKNIMYDSEISEIVYDADAALYPSPDKDYKQHIDCVYSNDKPEAANELIVCEGDNYFEAEILAQRIEQLIAECKIIDDSTGFKRSIKYSDIAILGCKKTLGIPIKDVFKAHNIPLCAQEISEDNSNADLSPILSLLNMLIIRTSDIDLITVMLNSIGGFTPTELAEIRTSSNKKSFYEAVKDYSKPGMLLNKIQDLFSMLDRFELLQKSTSIAELIRMICEETGYVYRIASLSKNDTELVAYNSLIENARAYASFSDGGLRGFLDYRRKYIDNTKEAFVLDENDNSVHFMTIHKSKGLEFPVVIMLDTLNNAKGNDNIYKFSESLGFGFDHYNIDSFGVRKKAKSFAKFAINIKEKQLSLAEEMRLLYVGLTRAKNKLIISCSADRKTLEGVCAYDDSLNVKTFKSYAHLILPLIYDHKDGEPLRKYIDDERYIIDTDKFSHQSSDWKVTVKIQQSDDIATAEETAVQACSFNKEEYLNNVAKALSWQYPYAEAVTERTKQTPSKQHLRTKLALRRPMFEDKEYKGAQKGTVVHFFMEHISFASNKTVMDQANEMLDAGILSKDEYNALPFGSIEAFMQSEFAQKMKNAQLLCRERSFCLIVPFKDTGDEALIQGIIDCYFFYNDTIYLLDYKTDLINNNLNERIEHHTPQIHMYRSALEKMYPQYKVKAFIHFFSVNKTVEIE